MAQKKKHSSALKEKEGITPPSSLSDKAAKRFKERRKKLPSIQELTQGILNGNVTALSRGITLLESTQPSHQQNAHKLLKACLPYANRSFRLGITGVPGVGKSTFIERLGISLIEKGKKVAVLAVDPSSSLSKGSILGDKTRMETLAKEPRAYIRPSASGESLGGVARKTREAIVLCEAAGYDVIIIETVGVGQSETAVHSMTDFFLLLKLAGAGDDLQGIKRGIIEMADAIVINKSDGENQKAAKLAQLEFQRALHLYPPKESGWVPKTSLASALENRGIEDAWEMIETYWSQSRSSDFFSHKRKEQNKFWLKQTIEDRLKQRFYQDENIQKELEIQLQLLEDHKTTPFQAAEHLLSLAE